MSDRHSVAIVASAPILGQAQIANPKIYIAPHNGFESTSQGRFTKKGVPAQVVQTEEAADYTREIDTSCQMAEFSFG